MGRRLAGLFAEAGFATTLEDILPSNLRKAEALGSVVLDSPHRQPVRFAASIEDAVRSADFVIDSVPDELESKLEIFSLLDRMSPPNAILVTPTRSLSIADLASCTYRADRCLAVELPEGAWPAKEKLRLIATSLTSSEVLEAVVHVWRTAGFSVESALDSAEASVAAGTLF
jgi:3-hydroxybutyryl-CoA dehydrogenase